MDDFKPSRDVGSLISSAPLSEFPTTVPAFNITGGLTTGGKMTRPINNFTVERTNVVRVAVRGDREVLQQLFLYKPTFGGEVTRHWRDVPRVVLDDKDQPIPHQDVPYDVLY